MFTAAGTVRAATEKAISKLERNYREYTDELRRRYPKFSNDHTIVISFVPTS
jgi:hypothetical protein